MDGYDGEFWTLVEALIGTFSQEKALVGAFFVTTNFRVDLRLKLQCTVCSLSSVRCLKFSLVSAAVL